MTTKMYEALRYFEPVVQELEALLAALQASDLQQENRTYLAELLVRLRTGWDVLGTQIAFTSHCLKCNDTRVETPLTSPATPCSACSVGISVAEQVAELEKNRQWVADRLQEKSWTCQECGQVNTPGSRCTHCHTWRP